MKPITGSNSIAEILKQCSSARRIFDQYGPKGCGGENGPAEALEFFASVHQVNLEALLRDLNAEMQNPPRSPTFIRNRWRIISTGAFSRRPL